MFRVNFRLLKTKGLVMRPQTHRRNYVFTKVCGDKDTKKDARKEKSHLGTPSELQIRGLLL